MLRAWLESHQASIQNASRMLPMMTADPVRNRFVRRGPDMGLLKAVCDVAPAKVTGSAGHGNGPGGTVVHGSLLSAKAGRLVR